MRPKRAYAAALALFALALASVAAPARAAEGEPDNGSKAEAAPAFAPTWDRVANIKDAAERLGQLHRAGGPKNAYQFIDACYKTHSLAEAYSAPFESCIVQDYLETKLLVDIYSSMPPEVLQKLGVPQPEALIDAMLRRTAGAFATYKLPLSTGDELKQLVDQHGKPVFRALVLPNAAKEERDKTEKQPEKKKPDKGNKERSGSP